MIQGNCVNRNAKCKNKRKAKVRERGRSTGLEPGNSRITPATNVTEPQELTTSLTLEGE